MIHDAQTTDAPRTAPRARQLTGMQRGRPVHRIVVVSNRGGMGALGVMTQSEAAAHAQKCVTNPDFSCYGSGSAITQAIANQQHAQQFNAAQDYLYNQAMSNWELNSRRGPQPAPPQYRPTELAQVFAEVYNPVSSGPSMYGFADYNLGPGPPPVDVPAIFAPSPTAPPVIAPTTYTTPQPNLYIPPPSTPAPVTLPAPSTPNQSPPVTLPAPGPAPTPAPTLPAALQGLSEYWMYALAAVVAIGVFRR